MVSIFVRGERVAAISDTATLTRLLESGEPVEFRNDGGRKIGSFKPEIPLIPWRPELTAEDIDRIAAGEGFTFEEVKAKLGWK